MTGTLSQKLIPRLLARFGTLGVRIHDGKQPVATFPAAHADVGDLNIFDDEMELMVDVGNLTHGHFLPRNHEAPQEEREEEVIEQVMAFLDAVFDDQIEFWRSDIAGGWHSRGGGEPIGPNARRYTWSGPLSGASPKSYD
jgi:hypothetical protein